MRKILLIITLTASLLLNLALISSLDKESTELITTKFLLNIIEKEYGEQELDSIFLNNGYYYQYNYYKQNYRN